MASFGDLVKQLAEAHEREVFFLQQELERHRQASEAGWPTRPLDIDQIEQERGRTYLMSEHLSPKSLGSTAAMLPQPSSSGGEQQLEPEPKPQLSDGVSASVRNIVHELTDIEVGKSPISPVTASSKSSRAVVGNMRIRQEEKSLSESWVAGPMESVMGCLIMANVLLTLVQLQVRGDELGERLEAGVESASGGDPLASDTVFFAFEHVFNAIFLLELLIRISVLRMKFLRDKAFNKMQWFNVVDCVVVLFCSVDLYLTPLITSSKSPLNLMFARMLRLARLARTLKVIQVLRSFSKLRILLRTVAASILSFTWSMILLGAMNLGAAIFLCQMLQAPIADDNVDFEVRMWLYQMYGTAGKAMWTMFEFTFSGGWPTYARPVVENVHWAYSIFFALYVSIVVFAVTRIVTALFLKDTLNVANKDADFMVQESMKAKRDYTNKLKELFEVADSSGSGTIDFDEFHAMCSIPEVLHYFRLLELEISEVHAVFDLLDDGHGQVTYDDFVKGIFRLKGIARSMDIFALMRECSSIDKRCRRMEALMNKGNGVVLPGVATV